MLVPIFFIFFIILVPSTQAKADYESKDGTWIITDLGDQTPTEDYDFMDIKDTDIEFGDTYTFITFELEDDFEHGHSYMLLMDNETDYELKDVEKIYEEDTIYEFFNDYDLGKMYGTVGHDGYTSAYCNEFSASIEVKIKEDEITWNISTNKFDPNEDYMFIYVYMPKEYPSYYIFDFEKEDTFKGDYELPEEPEAEIDYLMLSVVVGAVVSVVIVVLMMTGNRGNRKTTEKTVKRQESMISKK